jgi:hypothetical protein
LQRRFVAVAATTAISTIGITISIITTINIITCLFHECHYLCMHERHRAFAAGFAVEWFFKAKLHSSASSSSISSSISSGMEDCPLWDEQGHDSLSSSLAVISAWLMWRRCLSRFERDTA